MKYTICRKCGHSIPSNSGTCPKCGKQKRKFILQAAGLIVFLILGVTSYIALRGTFPELSRSEGLHLVRGLTERGAIVKKRHPSWPDHICNLIAEGRIISGMSREQVRAAWGEPDHIYSTGRVNGKNEEWIVSVDGETIDLTFENGTLMDVKPSRRLTTP